MKVLLVFPPSWHPSQPYLSLPSLKAFLEQEGITVTQRDLNIELLETLLTWERVEWLYQRMKDELRLSRKESLYPEDVERHDKIREALEYIPLFIKGVEEAKLALRTKDFYKLDRYMESLKIIDCWLEWILAFYYPSQITALSNEMKYSPYSSREILLAINDEKRNPFLDLFKENFVSSILAEKPELLGISITFVDQIIPGFTLANLIKRENNDICIVIGGSIPTKLADVLQEGSPLFSIVDGFIAHEGEHALLELCKQLERKRDFKKVPGFIYQQNGGLRFNTPQVEDLNSLPTPDFDDLPLGLYLAPERVLPVRFSKGCYWRKCGFCSIPIDHQTFQIKRSEKVVGDIQTLVRKYKVSSFFFVDECMPVGSLNALSSQILERGLDLTWIGELRFERDLSRDIIEHLSKAGCKKLVFGLESYSQRVLDHMRKGVKKEDVDRIIEDCIDVGIAIHLYTMIGFPTETDTEALETLDFVLGNRKLTLSEGFSCLPCLFDLEKGAPIIEDPARFGLRCIKKPVHHDLSVGYFYEVEEGMTPEQAEGMYRYIFQKIAEKVPTFPHNYSLSDGLLYLSYL